MKPYQIIEIINMTAIITMAGMAWLICLPYMAIMRAKQKWI